MVNIFGIHINLYGIHQKCTCIMGAAFGKKIVHCMNPAAMSRKGEFSHNVNSLQTFLLIITGTLYPLCKIFRVHMQQKNNPLSKMTVSVAVKTNWQASARKTGKLSI